jgi:hypothetical protein
MANLPDMHTQVLQLRSKNAALRVELAALRCILALKAGFDPNQPRVRAGRREGGQWTDSGNGGSNARTLAEPASESADARAQRRKQHVLAGGGAQFSVAPNPNADATEPLHELPIFSQVDNYEAEIVQVAAELGINDDLIRAIMYMETTHGYYGIPGDFLSTSSSILPMNINVDFWGDVFGPRSNLDVPLNNIRAGATILSGIIANLPATASVAEIATLYNSLSATMVNDYGARTEAVYKSRPWERE